MARRKAYPSDVSDEEWAFVASYLCLLRPDAPQREHPVREVFNALRWVVRTGSPWRYIPHDLPPWEAVYQQTQRWIRAGVFEQIVHDLRTLLRAVEGRTPEPSAIVLDSRTLRSSPESGERAGYDGYKRTRGSKVHAAVDTLGYLLALVVTPANEQDRAQVAQLSESVQEATGESVETMPTPAARWPRLRMPMESGSTWSNCPRPSAASCFCRSVGWWSAASPGSLGSGAWPATTSVCRAPLQGCILLPSFASCSAEPSGSSA
jgi:transposase